MPLEQKIQDYPRILRTSSLFWTFLTSLTKNTAVESYLTEKKISWNLILCLLRPSGDNIAISSLGQKLASNSINVTGSFLIWRKTVTINHEIMTICQLFSVRVKAFEFGGVHKLCWQIFGLFWPPTPLRWYFLPYKPWQKQDISGLPTHLLL